jgi:LPXTG-site transpeptidase (sortase) family protein
MARARSAKTRRWRIVSRPGRLRRAVIVLLGLALLAFAWQVSSLTNSVWIRFPDAAAAPVPTPRASETPKPDSATLTVPALDRHAPVVFLAASDAKTVARGLDRGVVLLPQSARPGQPGNVFLTGHSNNWPWTGPYRRVFAHLDRLQPGDRVTVTWDRPYTYVVTGQRLVSPHDVSILDNDYGRHQLTLMTCWPPGTTFTRRVVTAELRD